MPHAVSVLLNNTQKAADQAEWTNRIIDITSMKIHIANTVVKFGPLAKKSMKNF